MSLKKIEDALSVLGYTGEIVGFDLASEEGYCTVKLKISPVGIDISEEEKKVVEKKLPIPGLTPFEQFCKDHPEPVTCVMNSRKITIQNTKFIFSTNFQGDSSRDKFKSTTKRANIVIPNNDPKLHASIKAFNYKKFHTNENEEILFLPVIIATNHANPANNSKVYLNGVFINVNEYSMIDALTDKVDVTVDKVSIRPSISTINGEKDLVTAYVDEIYISSKEFKKDPWIVKDGTDEKKEEEKESKSRWKTSTPKTTMRYVYFKKEQQAKNFVKEYEKDFEFSKGQTLGKDGIQPYKIRKNHSDNDLYAKGYMWSVEFRMNGAAFQVLEQCENLKKKTTGNRGGHCVRYKEG